MYALSITQLLGFSQARQSNKNTSFYSVSVRSNQASMCLKESVKRHPKACMSLYSIFGLIFIILAFLLMSGQSYEYCSDIDDYWSIECGRDTEPGDESLCYGSFFCLLFQLFFLVFSLVYLFFGLVLINIAICVF